MRFVRLFGAILLGGLVAGALDLIYALVVYGSLGVSELQVMQSIASGAIGERAYDGGTGTATLGVAIHFGLTLLMAAIYCVASLFAPLLREHPVPLGLAYGVGIFFVMNYMLVPASFAVGVEPPTGSMMYGALAIHALGVGLPIAAIARAIMGRR